VSPQVNPQQVMQFYAMIVAVSVLPYRISNGFLFYALMLHTAGKKIIEKYFLKHHSKLILTFDSHMFAPRSPRITVSYLQGEGR
jgi:hypothetical protein